MSSPLAYFITFTTYGTWLHGRAPGSVDRQHNVPGTAVLPADEQREIANRQAMRQPCYVLDEQRREVVLRTIREVCHHRQWLAHAIHVRSNHVHVVVTAPCTPERVMNDLKAWASRRLRETFREAADRDRWTQHGSTRYLNSEAAVDAAVRYTLEEQGDCMAAFDGRNVNEHEPEA